MEFHPIAMNFTADRQSTRMEFNTTLTVSHHFGGCSIPDCPAADVQRHHNYCTLAFKHFEVAGAWVTTQTVMVNQGKGACSAPAYQAAKIASDY